MFRNFVSVLSSALTFYFPLPSLDGFGTPRLCPLQVPRLSSPHHFIKRASYQLGEFVRCSLGFSGLINEIDPPRMLPLVTAYGTFLSLYFSQFPITPSRSFPYTNRCLLHVSISSPLETVIYTKRGPWAVSLICGTVWGLYKPLHEIPRIL